MKVQESIIIKPHNKIFHVKVGCLKLSILSLAGYLPNAVLVKYKILWVLSQCKCTVREKNGKWK